MSMCYRNGAGIGRPAESAHSEAFPRLPSRSDPIGAGVGEDAPTPGDFERWLKPCDALERLPADWGRGHSINAVLTNLKVGMIQAWTRAGRLTTADGLKHVSFHAIPAIYWDELSWTNGPEALWVTGQVSFHIGRRTKGAEPGDWIEHIFTDVRFDPGQFTAAFDLETTVDSSVLANAAPLSVAETRRFLTVYLDVFGTEVVEAKALSALRACYPEHSIPRDQFREILRELRGPGSIGKPKKVRE